MDKSIERGIVPDPALELRAGKKDSPGTIAGYAAVYNSLSEDLGGFVETIKPGAFDNSLSSGPDVSARVQHEGGLTTVGRTTNGTLRLKSDDKGLAYEADLPNTQAGRDVAELIKQGYIDKSSFAFRVRPGGQEWDWETSPVTRTLTDLDLFDVAPVDGPAYQATSVNVRNMAQTVLQEARKQAGPLARPELPDSVDEETRRRLQQEHTRRVVSQHLHECDVL